MRSATRAGGVVAGRHEGDAVPQPDALRALAAGGEEDLGRGGVRVLLEEVVLDLPRVVDAEAVGQLDLVERLLEEPVLVAVVPGARDLVLVEDAELHRGPPVAPSRRSTACRVSARRVSWNSAKRLRACSPGRRDDGPERPRLLPRQLGLDVAQVELLLGHHAFERGHVAGPIEREEVGLELRVGEPLDRVDRREDEDAAHGGRQLAEQPRAARGSPRGFARRSPRSPPGAAPA